MKIAFFLIQKCKWLNLPQILKLETQKLSHVKELCLVVLIIARFVSVPWIRPRMTSCAPKQMWKITSGVFIVFLLRKTLKRPYNE